MTATTGPKFIVLEGIDGSGTTTQCTRLATWLRERGHAVLETREPSTGSVGRLVREQLGQGSGRVDHQTLALLFAADRLDHLAIEVEPALRAGHVVVCDRYLLSSYAYQGLTSPRDWIESINRRARRPDLTLWLDIEADVAAARVAARRATTGEPEERFDQLSLQRRLATGYRELAEEADDTVRIDASGSVDGVATAIAHVCAAVGL